MCFERKLITFSRSCRVVSLSEHLFGLTITATDSVSDSKMRISGTYPVHLFIYVIYFQM